MLRSTGFNSNRNLATSFTRLLGWAGSSTTDQSGQSNCLELASRLFSESVRVKLGRECMGSAQVSNKHGTYMEELQSQSALNGALVTDSVVTFCRMPH